MDIFPSYENWKKAALLCLKHYGPGDSRFCAFYNFVMDDDKKHELYEIQYEMECDEIDRIFKFGKYREREESNNEEEPEFQDW